MFPIITWQIGTLSVPVYALLLILATIVSICLFVLDAGRYGLSSSRAWRLAGLSTVSGLFFARLVYCMVRYEYMFHNAMDGAYLGLLPFFYIDQGGLSLPGLLLGVWGTLFVDAKVRRIPAGRQLDAATLPLAVFVTIARWGKILSGQGYGGVVETPWLCFFPFAIQDTYGDWFIAVFALEGLVALLILGRLLYLRRKPLAAGDLYLYFLIPLYAAQIFLESLHQDDYLRLESNGFIRINQVLAMAGILVIAAWLTIRAHKQEKSWWQAAGHWLVVMFSAGAAIAAEFYEKLPYPEFLLYAISAVAQVVLAVVLMQRVWVLSKQYISQQ